MSNEIQQFDLQQRHNCILFPGTKLGFSRSFASKEQGSFPSTVSVQSNGPLSLNVLKCKRFLSAKVKCDLGISQSLYFLGLVHSYPFSF